MEEELRAQQVLATRKSQPPVTSQRHTYPADLIWLQIPSVRCT